MSDPLDHDLPDDALRAYLFRSVGDPELVAVARDSTGATLPSNSGGWQLEQAFALGVHEALPVAMNPEPIMRGIMANGYFMWREGDVTRTTRTAE